MRCNRESQVPHDVIARICSQVEPEVAAFCRCCFEQVREPVSVEGLATRFGIHRRMLEYRLAQAGSPAPARVMAWTRAIHAAYLLSQNSHSVETVALQCGYCSAMALRKTFKRCGLKVSEVRQAPGFEMAIVSFIAVLRTKSMGKTYSIARSPSLLTTILAACSLALAGCGSVTELITPPPPPPTSLRIEFRPEAEDSATARVLGWQSGIPEVELTLQPEDTTKGGPLSFRGTVEGSLALDSIPPGRYVAVASRWLTETERGQLVASDDALGFVTKARLNTATGGTQTLRLAASRKRGLLISEFSFNRKFIPGLEDYPWSGFLELFNNSDTTIYLDGMIVAEGWWGSTDAPPNFPCSIYEAYRNDPAGIWSRVFQQFPGRGHDYPVAPGMVVVIATDAIDHRPFFPGSLDLRGADFEFSGIPDVDNPAVPNMIDLSLKPPPRGHGPGAMWGGHVVLPFIALPVDVPSLPLAIPIGADWARFPADAILDVLSRGTNYPGIVECTPLVAPRFDRASSHALGNNETIEYEYSVSRLVVPGSGGRRYLQSSRSSDADFIRTPRSPGQLPQ